MISHLLLTEPAPLAASQDDSTNDSSLRTLLTLCDLLNRELLVLIGWAKQIPGTDAAVLHFKYTMKKEFPVSAPEIESLHGGDTRNTRVVYMRVNSESVAAPETI